jgi:hypothetical protein
MPQNEISTLERLQRQERDNQELKTLLLEVLQLFELQQRYFTTSRNGSIDSSARYKLLKMCRAKESHLQKKIEEAVLPFRTQELFT